MTLAYELTNVKYWGIGRFQLKSSLNLHQDREQTFNIQGKREWGEEIKGRKEEGKEGEREIMIWWWWFLRECIRVWAYQ